MSEGTNVAKCMVELVQANQLLNTQVINGREENLRLRQENDALKASAELKSTVENLTAQVERLELEATKKDLEQLIVNLNQKRDQEREEMMLSMAELKECLRVQHINVMNNSLMRLEQQQHERFDMNKSAFEQLIVTFNEKNDEIKSSMAAMRKKLRLYEQNTGIHATSKKDTNEGQTMYSIPSQTTDFLWKRSKTSFAFSSIICVWENDILDCPPLLFGNKYKWSIKVESIGENFVELGVASTIHKLNFKEDFAWQKGGWSYDSLGYAHHANNKIKSNLPKIPKTLQIDIYSRFDWKWNSLCIS